MTPITDNLMENNMENELVAATLGLGSEQRRIKLKRQCRMEWSLGLFRVHLFLVREKPK